MPTRSCSEASCCSAVVPPTCLGGSASSSPAGSPLRCSRFVSCRTPARTTIPYDTAGAVTVTGGLLVLVSAIVKAQGYGWGSSRTVALFVLAFVLLAAFVVIERRSKAPLIRLGIFRMRSLSGNNAAMLIVDIRAADAARDDERRAGGRRSCVGAVQHVAAGRRRVGPGHPLDPRGVADEQPPRRREWGVGRRSRFGADERLPRRFRRRRGDAADRLVVLAVTIRKQDVELIDSGEASLTPA